MNLYEKARGLIPGGVNSPVRAFRSVDMDPVFIRSAKGPYLYDVNGNRYIDYIDSWGPMILGHGREDLIEKAKGYLEEGLTFGLPSDIEVEMAELVTKATGTQMVRMVNSGTEATMSAIRLARGYTGREKLIKFEGCYHGHSDSLLVKSGSGTLTFNAPTSAGVPMDTIKHTLVCEYNNMDSVREVLREFPGQIACVILEPIAGNMGVVPPDIHFLTELRELTREEGILLIFDEVITGFRIGYGSVSKDWNMEADLYCFGKIIGGGLPVGAFAGPREIMNHLSPVGDVYQAGTLSGNPLAMKMGRDVLTILRDNPQIYQKMEDLAERLDRGLTAKLEETKTPGVVKRYRSMLSLFFGEFEDIRSYEDVKGADTQMYARYFKEMLAQGILLAPAQFEGIFLSDAHNEELIDYTIEAAGKAMLAMRK
ncbi:MAG: glutamate-1-semialdehyde 2,1-aminomutase [Tissierellia bacterium]|nr:glutamate-1-semialdehyde 2,1-aminomutase [Tissierellia bacterium]